MQGPSWEMKVDPLELAGTELLGEGTAKEREITFRALRELGGQKVDASMRSGILCDIHKEYKPKKTVL